VETRTLTDIIVTDPSTAIRVNSQQAMLEQARLSVRMLDLATAAKEK